MSGGFQQQVYSQPAIGVAGDFATTNPYFTYDAGPGGLVAGANGVVIGNFAWVQAPLDPNNAPSIATSNGFGPVAGFVQRAQQGLNPTFLSDAGMTILKGLPVTLFTGGDFIIVNSGAAQATVGLKAFANLLTGAVSFAAAGTSPGGASDSGGAVVSTTLTVVGSVVGNLLTVTTLSAGNVYPGAVLNSNAVGQVVSQVSGTANGVGTYLLSVGEQNVAAGTTIGGNYGVYTVGTATGVFAVGMVLSGGSTLPTGASAPVLTALISGSGSNGSTFATNSGTAAQTSHALVGSVAIETKWVAMNAALTGENVMITSQPTG
jgi:hypothetical protein